MSHEQEFEQLLREKGLDAPRVKPEHIDDVILYVHYHSPADSVTDRGITGDAIYHTMRMTTLCTIVLVNGFTVTGVSSCISPQNYDYEIGRQAAYEDARRQIWPLMGFLLKEHLYRARLLQQQEEEALDQIQQELAEQEQQSQQEQADDTEH